MVIIALLKINISEFQMVSSGGNFPWNDNRRQRRGKKETEYSPGVVAISGNFTAVHHISGIIYVCLFVTGSLHLTLSLRLVRVLGCIRISFHFFQFLKYTHDTKFTTVTIFKCTVPWY